ncbi:RagB/SusD family nutrient uptake outer membrane protein [Chitinophaga pollutisoli]|uniref:RagB/SusD family nutrient uptake outer membrane protein n=1 Tax=Chitinophaga pollutisoli TaxID=3133966 RepID=A0ABZ2YSJ5_9BACT
MRNILFIIFSICVAGCQPSLDLSPDGWKASSTFYRNAADAEAAVTGAYSVLHEVYKNEHILTPNVICADDGIPFLTGAADRVAIWKYEQVSTNSYSGQIWSSAYRGIQFSNIILARVPVIPMDENLKKQYLGEAHYLRALHYFNLVRFYGGVPLVTNEITTLAGVEMPKAGIDEVYGLIEADLKAAETALPRSYASSANIGRATMGAAKGLLAKVYLARAGNVAGSPYWSQAAAKAKEVIDLGIYDLWEDYADVFAIKNRGGKESLFEVVFLTDIQGNSFTTGYAPRGAPIVPNNGYGIFRVSKSLFEAYTPNDKRTAVTFLTSYVHPVTQQTVQLSVDNPDPALAVSFWKLADPTVKVGVNGGTSWPYMRYSEILLIYAEALSEANGGPGTEAYDAINEVRNRAGLDDLSGLNAATFKDAILEERRLEFCFEGQRWFDLVRTGRLAAAVKAENSFSRNATVQAHQVWFPIPQREIDANSALDQIKGY